MQSIRSGPRRLAVVFFCQFLVLQPLFGQQGFRIVVVEGSNARNVVQQIAARPIAVRVEDAGGRPVSGATVTFTAPSAGPSGDFANDSPSLTVFTGDDGIAAARGYHPNALTGGYQIQVRAEYQGQTTSTSVAQSNITQGKGHGKTFLIVGIAAAAGAAIVVRERNSSSNSTPTITFGGAAVGAPHP
jgi:hypothetical protein